MTAMKMTAPAPFLGIECGGTRTIACLLEGENVQEWRGGPANIKLVTDAELKARFQEIGAVFPKAEAVVIGMAGMRTAEDQNRIQTAAGQVWPEALVKATNDLEIALAAGSEEQLGAKRVLVLSGTGSCCFGDDGRNQLKVGGWGHILGDRGSGYAIALAALRESIAAWDRTRRWPELGSRLLRELLFNNPDQLIGWILQTPKQEIAALAPAVFASAKEGDALARKIIAEAAGDLTSDALACAEQISRRSEPVLFVLAGGVLLNQPSFAQRIRKALLSNRRNSTVRLLEKTGAWGAVRLAANLLNPRSAKLDSSAHSKPATLNTAGHAKSQLQPAFDLSSLKRSPTEQRNPRSKGLDRLSIEKGVELFLDEEKKVSAGLLQEKEKIAQVIRWIASAFRNGGRLFYVGAGTSGRLGVLDASECPPTFRADPSLVQGIIAGGQTALWQSAEGAEDDAQAGAQAIQFRNVTAKDVVIGIAASGRTPFVWGALAEAKKRRARAILLAFNPSLKPPEHPRLDLLITPNVGPELLTGSTRLKSGTATKLVLNLFTTLAMVQIGKVRSNLMIDLNPSNVKLRDRAVRIVSELTGADYVRACASLEKCGWVVKKAVAQLESR